LIKFVYTFLKNAKHILKIIQELKKINIIFIEMTLLK